MTAYSASKGAVIAFTRAAAAEVGLTRHPGQLHCARMGGPPFNAPAISYMGGPGHAARQDQPGRPARPPGHT